MKKEINELKENTYILKNIQLQEESFINESSVVHEMVDHWIDVNTLIIDEKLEIEEKLLQKRIEKTSELIRKLPRN